MGIEYLHPSVNSRIVDNSQTFSTTQGSTVLFAAGRATKGEDNKLIRLTNVEEAEFKVGLPDMAKTGQTLYNVFNWLKANGEAYFIRVLPVDAAYANAMLSIGTDVDGTNLTVIPTIKPIANVISIDVAKTLVNSAPVTTGTTTVYPLAMFLPKGRGEAYNGLGIKISPLDSLDATYPFRTYSLSITEKDTVGNDVVVEGPYTVAFEPTAKDRNRESIYFANVINKYSLRVTVVATDANYDAIRTFINNDATVNPLNLDIFFGKERNGSSVAIHNKVKFATPLTSGLASNQVTLSTASNLLVPNTFDKGFEGTWTGANSEDSLVARAYSGEIDSDVLDKKQYLFDIVLDGNTSPVVKNAMHDLATNIRGDLMTILDCGFQATAQQTLDQRSNVVNMSSFNTAVFGQDLVFDDEYTGSTIKVTVPYVLATKIPSVDIAYGIQYSFSGPRRGVVSGFKSINFIPNEAWKESLYKQQVNYIEKDPKRYNIGTQLTSQTVASALSKINNVRALLRIRREVEALVDEYRDEFQNSATYDSMNYNLNQDLQKWVNNGACSTISAKVYASDYDKAQNIARVKVELRFTGLIERIYVDFVVNR